MEVSARVRFKLNDQQAALIGVENEIKSPVVAPIDRLEIAGDTRHEVRNALITQVTNLVAVSRLDMAHSRGIVANPHPDWAALPSNRCGDIGADLTERVGPIRRENESCGIGA